MQRWQSKILSSLLYFLFTVSQSIVIQFLCVFTVFFSQVPHFLTLAPLWGSKYISEPSAESARTERTHSIQSFFGTVDNIVDIKFCREIFNFFWMKFLLDIREGVCVIYMMWVYIVCAWLNYNEEIQVWTFFNAKTKKNKIYSAEFRKTEHFWNKVYSNRQHKGL